ncbi:MAG: AbrB/MazE/SpoVT family DNA-binding domain-containing protein [Thermomicrobiales bacterium]|nr:AbrB/MazE/SpoVT family DNA-binding domain-containing protein [Thermomicrobiales bacterium]
MHSATCTITSKGQVTLPKKIRKQLGVDVGDKVTFVVNSSGGVEVRPRKYSFEDLQGIVPTPPGMEHRDFDEVIEEAILEDFARQTAELMAE